MRRAYLDALAELAADLPAGVYSATIVHRDECSPSRCVCGGEDIRIVEATEETIAEGAASTRRWIEETSS